MSRADLVDMLQASREKNRRQEITGLLLYANGSFMQVLEGKEKVVRDLMKRIEVDGRHHHVETLEVAPLARRAFPKWSMAFLDLSLPTPPDLPGYSRFLESAVTDREIIRPKARSRELLLNFKLVMKASSTTLRGLLEAFPED